MQRGTSQGQIGISDSCGHLLTSKRKISYLDYDLSLQQRVMVLDVGDILR